MPVNGYRTLFAIDVLKQELSFLKFVHYFPQAVKNKELILIYGDEEK
jgi:hypothetical protein